MRRCEEPDDAADEATRSRTPRPDVVCLVAPSDELPLRLALLVRHLDEDVPIVATIFDRAIAEQLEEAVPRLDVTSLADVAAPSLAGPCVAGRRSPGCCPAATTIGPQAVGDDARAPRAPPARLALGRGRC